jgi:hypothetical protein
MDGDGTVSRVPKAGGMVETLAVKQKAPFAIALDTSRVYWVNGEAVLRADLDGKNPLQLGPPSSIGALAVDANYAYFSWMTDIYRVAK